MLEISRHIQSRTTEINLLLESSEKENLGNIIKHELDRISDMTGLFRLNNPVICHKDLKPENIILTPSGDIRFIDFAFANYCDPAFDVSYLSRNARLTPVQTRGLVESYGESLDSDFYKRMEIYVKFCRVPCIIWHVDRLRNPKYTISEKEKTEYRNYFGLYLKEYLEEDVVNQGVFSLLR